MPVNGNGIFVRYLTMKEGDIGVTEQKGLSVRMIHSIQRNGEE